MAVGHVAPFKVHLPFPPLVLLDSQSHPHPPATRAFRNDLPYLGCGTSGCSIADFMCASSGARPAVSAMNAAAYKCPDGAISRDVLLIAHARRCCYPLLFLVLGLTSGGEPSCLLRSYS